jgi:hypothetical protein
MDQGSSTLRSQTQKMNWDQAVSKVSPYIVKIQTPTGSGTGFLCVYNDDKSWCGIATASHVVADADAWQQPLKIFHYSSGKEVFLKESERVIFTDWKVDSAVILFQKKDLQLPEFLIGLLSLDKAIPIGSEVGWLGFPAIDEWTLCFFSGNISARREDRKAYLIDGVAINGVSGGPVIFSDQAEGVLIVGTVSAYSANRTTGDWRCPVFLSLKMFPISME